MDKIIHVCEFCDTELDGDRCAAHPNAPASRIIMPDLEAHLAYRLCCDRCGDTAEDPPEMLVAAEYLIDDPYLATDNLCPACARADDANHIPGSWLLSWTN